MKIVDKKKHGQALTRSFWLLAFAGVLVAGILLGSRGVVNDVHESWVNLQRRLTGWTPSQELPVMSIDIGFDNYSQLLQQRELGIRQGVLFPEDTPLVAADLQLLGEQTPIWIRLLPGPAQHLGTDEKWNFELQSRDTNLPGGITRTNLIDPADNGWLNEWAFIESLRREGILSGAYRFVRLVMNGDDKGIYALQETLSPLVYAENPARGQAVVSYDPAPLLNAIARYGDLQSAVADPLSNIAPSDPRFLEVREIGDPLIQDDIELSNQAERATTLLRALQSGMIQASDVFDAEQYGRFLALLDLWGATNALSPFNISYAYDPESDRLRPIALNGEPLQRDTRVPLDAMYDDPRIQAAYAASVAEISKDTYLSELRAAIEPELETLARGLNVEQETGAIWDELTERQRLLGLSLEPIKPVIAQLGSPELAQDAIIRVNVANALNVPVEILGFDIDAATFLEVDRDWIVEGQPFLQPDEGSVILKPAENAGGLGFVTFDLPVTEIIRQDQELDFLNEIQVQVATRVLGVDRTQLTPASPGVRNNS